MNVVTESDYVFQADSELVNTVYANDKNYLVENSQEPKETHEKFCAIYFSSNNIYYPNKESEFTQQIIEKNRFEWYGTRIERASKHIFIRDLHKQWYITGVNSKIDNPKKIYEFLKQATKGYKIITVGSSSGGFAAVLFGQLLSAEHIYTFNGQFEVNSLLNKSSKSVDPILFRNQNNEFLRTYYDLKTFIKDPSKILYFRSNKSPWDVEQYSHIKNLGINSFSFNTDHHGIPFAKTALPRILNMKVRNLNKFTNKNLNPLIFSLQVAGLKQTSIAVLPILKKIFKL